MTARKPTEWIPSREDIRVALFASSAYDSSKMSFHNWRTLRVVAGLWLREQDKPDHLGEALNSGDGSYKP